MQVNVIVMAEKNTQSIMDWQLRPDRKGNLRAVFSNGSTQTPERAWKKLALRINRRALRGSHAPIEIFLYLRDGLNSSIYNYGTLETIVAAARDHAWGGKIYVVWEKPPSIMFEPTFGEEHSQILLAKCFCAFLREGVTDLIEITGKERPQGEYADEGERQILRGYAVSSENRREELKTIVNENGWSYVLRNEAWLLENLLNKFVKEGCLSSFSSNHVVIFDASPGFGPKELLDKFKRVNATKKGIVAATREGYSKDLGYQCSTETPPLKLLSFNGVFEVIYSLLQLNKTEKAKARQENFNTDVEVDIEFVESSGQFFPSSGTNNPRSILITSAHHPNEEPGHSIAAAKEIGELLRALPFNLNIEVHPCITCESLPDLVESKQVTAWIHLSHGEEDKGLYEPKFDEYASPERWLACFTSYKNSLKLVLFSSCESAIVARLFAEAGVSVAIGFKKEVLVEATRLLVKKVVPAVMETGSNQESILNAFRDACESLAARTISEQGDDVSYLAARPVAYLSNRKTT